jgi:uracil DNA glycosylase
MDLKEDFMLPNHGSLINWAKQGVLMIDAALTVKESAPTSHLYPIHETKTAWEIFISEECHGWDILKILIAASNCL